MTKITEPAKRGHMVKIWFKLDPAEWHRHSSESLWAEPVSQTPGAFRLMNSPLHADGVSFLDTVQATKDADGILVFKRVLKHSGHSTYMILVPPDSALFDSYWKKLASLGCSYEWGEQKTSMGPRRLYSVDVPNPADVTAVVRIFEEGEKNGIWMYQEGHRGHAGNSEA